jgi:hypothetical protein
MLLSLFTLDYLYITSDFQIVIYTAYSLCEMKYAVAIIFFTVKGTYLISFPIDQSHQVTLFVGFSSHIWKTPCLFFHPSSMPFIS